MKVIIKSIIFAIVLPFIFCLGCTGMPVRFNEMGPDFDRSKIDFSRPQLISTSKSGVQFLMFIPILTTDRQEDAYLKLRMMAPNCFITDVKLEEEWTYIYVGTIYKTTISATAYPYIK